MPKNDTEMDLLCYRIMILPFISLKQRRTTMEFEDILEIIVEDDRTHSIPVLFVVQVLMVILEKFRLEKKV